MMRQVLIVGGASGIGLAMAQLLAQRPETQCVHIVDRAPLPPEQAHPKLRSYTFDLSEADFAFFDQFLEVDALLITAGFGRLALFEDVSEQHIVDSMQVNATAAMRLVHRFYPRLLERERTFRLGIMVSIAGFMSSPFFAVYAASKAALRIFIESVNVELEQQGTPHRILNISPGSIKGTAFGGAHTTTDLTLTTPLARDILLHLERGDDLFIPQYEEVFREVLERYHQDFRAEGRHSYAYKVQSGRVPDAKPTETAS